MSRWNAVRQHSVAEVAPPTDSPSLTSPLLPLDHLFSRVQASTLHQGSQQQALQRWSNFLGRILGTFTCVSLCTAVDCGVVLYRGVTSTFSLPGVCILFLFVAVC